MSSITRNASRSRKSASAFLIGIATLSSLAAIGDAGAYDAEAEMRQRIYENRLHYENDLRQHDEEARRSQGSKDPVSEGVVEFLIMCAITKCFDKPLASAEASKPAQKPAPAVGQLAVPQPPATPTVSYRVVRVPRNDVLNMRNFPGGDIIGAIPPNGRGVTLQDCAHDWQGQPWCLATYGNQRGWVATAYLRQE